MRMQEPVSAMALKDWMKKRENWYKEKDGFQEIWMEEEKRSVTPLGYPSSFCTIATRYVVYHSYLGCAGSPDKSTFRTKAEAHKHIMKKVRGK